jgi:hypothetical protein
MCANTGVPRAFCVALAHQYQIDVHVCKHRRSKGIFAVALAHQYQVDVHVCKHRRSSGIFAISRAHQKNRKILRRNLENGDRFWHNHSQAQAPGPPSPPAGLLAMDG